MFSDLLSALRQQRAAEGGLTEVTSNESENGEKLQAKSIDGRDTLTEVSDLVLEMIHNEEIRYNEETGYLEDTGLRDAPKTGWKVDPIRGDEVEVIPANPDVPVTPEQPTDPANPDTPQQPSDGNVNNEQQPSEDQTEGSEENKAQEQEKNAQDSEHKMTNEELVKRQQIVSLPEYEEDFRFWTVARKNMHLQRQRSAYVRQFRKISVEPLILIGQKVIFRKQQLMLKNCFIRKLL